MRILLGIRAFLEGAIGFWLMVLSPFLAADMIRSTAPLPIMLAAVLGICLLFTVGILLFRDAIQLRQRL